MPPRRRKTGETSRTNSQPNEITTAKREEQSSKPWVFNTFRAAYQKIKNSFTKSVISAKTLEELEAALESRSIMNIVSRSRRMTVLIYVKSIQLFGAKGNRVVLKSNPQEAAKHLSEIATYINKHVKFNKEKTYGTLLAVARKIKTIDPRMWGALIKFFDISFENVVGSAMLSRFLNVKNLGSNQKLLDYIREREIKIKKLSQPIIPQTVPPKTTKQKQNVGVQQQTKKDPISLYKSRSATTIRIYLERIAKIARYISSSVGQPSQKQTFATIHRELGKMRHAIESDLGILRFKIRESEKNAEDSQSVMTLLKYHHDDYQAHNTLLWVVGVVLKVLNNERVEANDLNHVIEYFQKVGKEIAPIPTNPQRVLELAEPAQEILNSIVPMFNQYSNNYVKNLYTKARPRDASTIGHHRGQSNRPKTSSSGDNHQQPIHNAPNDPSKVDAQKPGDSNRTANSRAEEQAKAIEMLSKRTQKAREWGNLEQLVNDPNARLTEEDIKTLDDRGTPESTLEDAEKLLEDW